MDNTNGKHLNVLLLLLPLFVHPAIRPTTKCYHHWIQIFKIYTYILIFFTSCKKDIIHSLICVREVSCYALTRGKKIQQSLRSFFNSIIINIITKSFMTRKGKKNPVSNQSQWNSGTFSTQTFFFAKGFKFSMRLSFPKSIIIVDIFNFHNSKNWETLLTQDAGFQFILCMQR